MAKQKVGGSGGIIPIPTASSARNISQNVEDLYDQDLVDRVFEDTSISSSKLVDDFDQAGSAAAAEITAIQYAGQDIRGSFVDMGIAAWYEARTVQVGGAGNSVPSLSDITGDEHHLVQTSATKQPTYEVDADGIPYISFDGVDDFLRVETPVLTPETTIFVVYRFREQWATGSSSVFDASNNAINTMRMYRGSARKLFLNAGSALQTDNDLDDTTWNVYEIVINGASSSIVANSRTYTGNAGSDVATGITLAAYGLTTGLDNSAMDFRAMLIFSGTLTSTESNLVRRYLKTMTASPLVCIGDSITFGTEATAPITYGFAQQTVDHFGDVVSGFCVGVGGNTVATMLADAPRDIILYDYKGVALKTVVIFGGTNDIGALSTGADTEALLQRLSLTWQAAGFRVVVVTMLPRSAGTEAERILYNAAIRSNWASYADAIADVGDDATIGQAGDNENLTYYSVDQVHPIDAGHAIIFTYVRDAITWL